MHQSIDERKIMEQSTSSAIKRKFFMHVLRGTYEGNAISASQLVQEVQCSKRTIENFIADCEAANWIEVYRCNKNHRHITAMPILIKTYENYTDWLWKALDETGLRHISSAISELQKQVGQQE